MQDDFGLDTDTDAAYGLEGQEWSTGIGEPSTIDLPVTLEPGDVGIPEDAGASSEPSEPLAPGSETGDDEQELAQLPTDVRFGASIGPYGTTSDSDAEEYHYSTTEDRYYGAETGRTIDEWTGTEKT